MKMKSGLGRIITLGLLGMSLVAAIAIPSALAQNAGTAGTVGTAGQPSDKQFRGEGRGEKMQPFNIKDVTVTVAYLDNGTKETFVSPTADVIAQMKQFVTRLNARDTMKDTVKADAVKINVVAEATDTGMVVTTTSTDADTAARIINRAKIRELEKKLTDAKVDVRAATTRTVTETDKGVTVTISSDNADVAQLIKLREKYGMEGLRGLEPGNGFGMPMGRMGKGRFGNRGFEQPANADATQGAARDANTQATTTQTSNQ